MCTAPTEGDPRLRRKRRKKGERERVRKWKRKSERGGQCGARELTVLCAPLVWYRITGMRAWCG